MTKLSYLAAIATFTMAAGANASGITIGNGVAKRCQQAANSPDTGRQAVDACDQALTEQLLDRDDRAATLVNRGIIHLRRTSIDKAEADFDAALALDPTMADAWLNKAVLQVRYRRSADALPSVNKALQLKTKRPALAYYIRAMANEDTGKFAEAYRDLKLAIKLEPGWDAPAAELQRFKMGQLMGLYPRPADPKDD